MNSDALENIPAGFEPLFRESPFVHLLGPIYQKPEANGFRMGLLAVQKHCNTRGNVHGGVLSSIADFAMGYNLAFYGDKGVNAVTASLTIDYIGKVDNGDWIEVVTEVTKVGKRLAFAQAKLLVGDELVARANGVFNVLNWPNPATHAVRTNPSA